MAPGRILALDVGNRRIGLAVSDPLRLIAQPLATLQRTSPRQDIKSISRWVRKLSVDTLVVGLPLHASGDNSAQAERTRSFAEALFAALPACEHHLLDERLTSRTAHELLDRGSAARQSAADRIGRKQHIDQVAAAVLLHSFLERLGGPTLLPDPDFPGPPADADGDSHP